MRKKRSFTIECWIFAGALLLLFSVFAWRQFYGFNKNDEIFYISTVYRFFQGDAMLVDEWNNVQLFAFVTYPLYGLIRFFQDSNEGIVLLFRFFYLFFQVLVSVYCFLRMKRFGSIRVLPALYYFITTPYNINSLSYNTLAFGFVLLALVTITCPKELKFYDFILLGFFTAGAVLSNPYTLLLFILYGLVCGGTFLYHLRTWREAPSVLRIRNYFLACAGAFLIFVLFILFVFSRGTLDEILECITYIVMDTERQKSFWEKFVRYFVRIHRYYKVLVYVTGILTVMWIADRKKRVAPSVYLLLVSVTAIPYIIYYGFFWEMVGINYMLVPLVFPGLIAYLVWERKDHRLFYGWYLPGLFYTLLAHFATNTGILTVSASYMIPSAVSVLFLWKAVEEQGRIPWLRLLVVGLFTVQLGAGIWQRISYVWGDAHLPELTQKLTEGPLKGIHTSVENEQLYRDVLMDMDELSLTKEDRLFIIGIAPWMYLNTEAECAAYSTWETLETDPLIPAYYEIRREKLPTVVYCYEYEESILETEFAYYFTDRGYESVKMRRGIVFYAPGRGKDEMNYSTGGEIKE